MDVSPLQTWMKVILGSRPEPEAIMVVTIEPPVFVDCEARLGLLFVLLFVVLLWDSGSREEIRATLSSTYVSRS